MAGVIRGDFDRILGAIVPDAQEGMLAQATEELIAKLIDEMRQAAEKQGGSASPLADEWTSRT